MTKKNIFLTGLPGSGKTTVIARLAELLGNRASGFYTLEIRQKGRREGFEIVTLGGKRAVLAHADFASSFRVGRYGVDPESLREAVSELKLYLTRKEPKCLLIDEIGKMELFNPEFREAVLAALDSPLPVVATILARPHPFCDTLKKRRDVWLIEVSRENREELPVEIYNQVLACLGSFALPEARDRNGRRAVFFRPSRGAEKMKSCMIRFYAELNDFLPREKRQVAFEHRFFGRPSVKDIIESLGVPHTEVDLVLINGKSVEFSRQVNDGDYVSVYPVFESLDISPVLRVRPAALRDTRFLLDAHLGKLAAYLRMLGFDALYEKDLSDKELADVSVREHRILLTRDRGLLKRGMVTHGYLVRSSVPAEQTKEVLQRFDLFRLVKPFSRCICCNEMLKAVAKEEVQDRLPPKVRQHFSEFNLCQKCGHIYWKGSHYENMKRFVQKILVEE